MPWRRPSAAPALGPDGTVYIGSYEYTTPIGGALIAITRTGQVKWQYVTQGGVVGYRPAAGGCGGHRHELQGQLIVTGAWSSIGIAKVHY